MELVEMELKDSTDPSLKKIKGNIAELTQPARDLKGKVHTQNQKPQGQKQKNKPCAAKYNNWLTPFCWTQIIIMAKQVGRSMGASDIAIHLKKHDPVIFGQISRNMIEGWIDRSSGNPRWKDSVLQRVENGHNPGHNKGGHQGILVCFEGICSTKG
jgi:hypothetical protein